jgi:hypothetical protein
LLGALAGVTPFVLQPFEGFLVRSLSEIPFGATLILVTALLPDAFRDALLRLRSYRRNITLYWVGPARPLEIPGIRIVHLPFRSRQWLTRTAISHLGRARAAACGLTSPLLAGGDGNGVVGVMVHGHLPARCAFLVGGLAHFLGILLPTAWYAGWATWHGQNRGGKRFCWVDRVLRAGHAQDFRLSRPRHRPALPGQCAHPYHLRADANNLPSYTC